MQRLQGRSMAHPQLHRSPPLPLLHNKLQVLAEIRRLMPGHDPVAVLLSDPSGCLDMQVRTCVGQGSCRC